MPRLPADDGRASRAARHQGPRPVEAGREGPPSARRRRALTLLRGLLLLVLLVAGSAAAEPVRLTTRAVDLDPRNPHIVRSGQLDFVSGLELSGNHSRFGGYSGLVIDQSGTRLVAISDLGHWFVARIVRDESGRLRDIVDAEIHPILDRNGNPFTVKRAGDAEALERLPDGSFLVAFEQIHRVARYSGPLPWLSRAEPLAAPADLPRQPANGGIETMARLPDGRLLLISETDEKAPSVLKAWIGVGGTWREAGYRRHDGYRPVDGKALPNGDLLVLERHFTLLGGFSTRLVRISAAGIRPGAVMDGRRLAEIAPPLIADNFEGLALEPAADGSTTVFMISDDNRVALQRTLLLQFRLTP